MILYFGTIGGRRSRRFSGIPSAFVFQKLSILLSLTYQRQDIFASLVSIGLCQYQHNCASGVLRAPFETVIASLVYCLFWTFPYFNYTHLVLATHIFHLRQRCTPSFLLNPSPHPSLSSGIYEETKHFRITAYETRTVLGPRTTLYFLVSLATFSYFCCVFQLDTTMKMKCFFRLHTNMKMNCPSPRCWNGHWNTSATGSFQYNSSWM